MPSYIPDIQLLRAFLAVASELSFTRAGVKLNQTQSAVSHQIRKLETQLGSPLFHRHANQVDITEAGAALQSKLEPIIKQLDMLFATNAVQNERSVLEVELETGFATFWLMPRLTSFAERFPHIEITMNVSHRRLEFVENTELAIKWGRAGDWDGFSTEGLMELHITPLCSPALLSKLKGPDDLLQQILLHEKDYTLWGQWLVDAKLTVAPATSGHVFQDTAMLQNAAVRGHGVALLATELAAEAMQKGELVAPFPDLILSTDAAYHIIARTRRLSLAAQNFIGWLKAEISKVKKDSDFPISRGE